MRIMRETWLMAAICIADLTTTLWFVGRFGAAEGNPLMKYYLELGTLPFVLAKLTLFLVPLAILEWARQRNPRFVTGMLRVGIVLYLGSYATVVWNVNARAGAEERDRKALDAWASRPSSAADYQDARNRLRPMVASTTQ